MTELPLIHHRVLGSNRDNHGKSRPPSVARAARYRAAALEHIQAACASWAVPAANGWSMAIGRG